MKIKKDQKYKIMWKYGHGEQKTSMYLDLEEVFLNDDTGVEVSLDDFLNYVTSSIESLEIRVAELNGLLESAK